MWIHLDARLMSVGIVPGAAGDEHKESWFSLGTHELLIRRERESPPWNEHAPAVLTIPFRNLWIGAKIDRFHLQFFPPSAHVRPPRVAIRGKPCSSLRKRKVSAKKENPHKFLLVVRGEEEEEEESERK